MLSQSSDRRIMAQRVDDFWSLDTGIWTDINDGATGAVAVSTAAGAGGGVLSNATVATANDYHCHIGTKALEALADLPFRAAIRFKITEATANSSHWIFGVTDTTTTGGLTATTGATLSSYCGALFTKPAGAAVIKCESANATVKTTNATAATFVSGAWTELVVEFDPGNGTVGYFSFYFNGAPTNAAFAKIPKQPIALSGMTRMGLIFGVMASTAAAETMLVDVAGWEIAR